MIDETRRTKAGIDSDAIPPRVLLDLAHGAIERHVDPARVAVLEAAETSDRELLRGFPAMLRAPG